MVQDVTFRHAIIGETIDAARRLTRAVWMPLWRELNGSVERQIQDLTMSRRIRRADATGSRHAAGAPLSLAI
jgi:hypothetical protein